MGERVKLKRQDRMVAWVFFKIRQIGEDEMSFIREITEIERFFFL